MSQREEGAAGRTLIAGRVTAHGLCREPSPEPCGTIFPSHHYPEALKGRLPEAA